MDTNPAGAARPTTPDMEEFRLLADRLVAALDVSYGAPTRPSDPIPD